MKPIFNKLLEFNKRTHSRFHMPGHNGQLDEISPVIDITELPGMDNLLTSEEIIKEGEDLAAKAYEKKFALYSTNGSTNCMFVAMSVVKNLGYSIYAYKQMHSSFYNALEILGLNAKVYDDFSNLKNSIQSDSSLVALFTTSPDYFGNNKDLLKLKKLVKDGLLIVDSAHGAHFAYSSFLDNQCKNADIAFMSMHKTMDVLTGGAVMVMEDENLYNLAKYYRAKLHSTSPNYMVLASMDLAREDYQKNGQKYYAKIKEKVQSYFGTFGPFTIVQNDDFSRLVLKKEGVNCYLVLEKLSELGFEIEMAYEDMLVLILTHKNIDKLDKLKDTLDKLEYTKLDIPKLNIKKVKKIVKDAKVEFVNIDDAINQISASEVGIYPPAVPIVEKYDLIDESIIDIIKANKGRLFGIVNDKIAVLK